MLGNGNEGGGGDLCDGNLKATISNTDYDRPKTAGELEYFNYFSSKIINDARCTQEVKSRSAMVKAAFSKKKSLFDIKLHLNSREELVKCYIWSRALYGVENWTLRKVDQKYLESHKMLCWRNMEKIMWINHVRNEEVLQKVDEKRNILQPMKRRKAPGLVTFCV
jgi:hypothetical protein